MTNLISEAAASQIKEAVRKTGRELIRIQSKSEVIAIDQAGEYIDDPQLYTQADKLSGTWISEAIRSVSPFPIFTEDAETGVRHDFSELGWIIDPIDGSTQYHHRLPLFSISIALCRGSTFEPQWGLIYAPVLKLFYEAAKGEGAYCNGGRIHCGEPKPLDELFVSISAYRSFERVQQLDIFYALLANLKQIRQFGCPSLDICFVADGRLDARVIAGYKIWDVAAAMLIASESGAVVIEPESGKPASMDSPIAVVGNGKNIELILSRLGGSKSRAPGKISSSIHVK